MSPKAVLNAALTAIVGGGGNNEYEFAIIATLWW